MSFHHITHIDNFKEMINTKKIIARNFLEKIPQNWLSDEIKEKYSNINGKNLNEYIPFYVNIIEKYFGIDFNSRIREMFTSEKSIFLVIDENALKQNSLFYICDPLSTESKEFTSFSKFKEEFWEKFKRELSPKILNYDKNDELENPSFLKTEALVYKELDINYIKVIYVFNEENKILIEKWLSENKLKIKVVVNKIPYRWKINYKSPDNYKENRENKFHHITHIKNIEDILRSKKLLARNFIEKIPEDTADPGIIDERKILNTYVPFHLNIFQENYGISYNWRLYNRKYAKYQMVFLIFNQEMISEETLFSIYHPTSRYEDNGYYSHNGWLDHFKLSYEEFKRGINNCCSYLVRKYSENLSNKDHEVKQFLMSEVLMYKEVNLKFLKEIYIHDNFYKEKIEELLREADLNVPVIVKPAFYR